MNWTFGTRRQIALIATIVTLAGTTAFAAVELKPTPLTESRLGAAWQCSKTAGIMTVCTRNAAQASRPLKCPKLARLEAVS
jgi:hypothetical protein